jgi:hypothetical protein
MSVVIIVFKEVFVTSLESQIISRYPANPTNLQEVFTLSGQQVMANLLVSQNELTCLMCNLADDKILGENHARQGLSNSNTTLYAIGLHQF